MGNPIATVIGGALIAAAILITNHWELGGNPNLELTLRLNRWNGAVEICSVDAKSFPGNPNSLVGATLACERR
jgi:hypothetical protein